MMKQVEIFLPAVALFLVDIALHADVRNRLSLAAPLIMTSVHVLRGLETGPQE